MKVRELLESYIRHSLATNLHGPAALDARKHTFLLFNARYGDERVADMKRWHLTEFIEGTTAWASVSTRRAKACHVKAAFQWAFEEERIGRNPFSSVKYGEAERRPDLPDADFARLCHLANKPVERAARFLRLTWCRVSELCRAEFEHFDLERGEWTIARHKSRKRSGKPKVISLVPEAIALIRAAAAERLPGLAVGIAFLNNRGRPWKRGTLAAWLRRTKRKHGFETQATLHGLRHRGASCAIGNGAPLKLVAEQLGHSNTQVCEAYYWNRNADHIEAIRSATQAGVPHPKKAE